MEVLHCSKDENIERALMMAEKARGKGAKLIVLPEVFSTGFCYDALGPLAESSPSSMVEDYPTIRRLAGFSEKCDCILIGSLIEVREGDKKVLEYYNLGFCIEAGILAGVYRKTHIYGREKKYFSKGTELLPIKLQSLDLKLGLEICYDLRFPEVARTLALEGADILVTIAEFANPKAMQWKALAASRAIENQLPHIACNRVGRDPYASYFGSSLLIDAWGVTRAVAGGEECVILYDVDTAETKKIRRKVPLFNDRQPELYWYGKRDK